MAATVVDTGEGDAWGDEGDILLDEGIYCSYTQSFTWYFE